MTDVRPHNPTLLGDFRIHGVLGEGGSGTVYDARWGHREVALKVLRGDLGDGERARFLAEARLLVEMTHPGVVKVLAAGALPDGRPYLAMERLPGETLAHRLARGPLPLAHAVGLFTQLCDAVGAMHARALIHRDLKPENVMLVPGPSGEHAVLLDFGIAKTASDGVAAPTQSGLVRGTPAYMAPERFFGHPASVATDVYELAVTFFAMAAGRLPWADSADAEVRLNPARLADVATVPPALDELIARALSTRAPNRPESAAALCEGIVAAAGLDGAAIVRHTAPVETSQPARAPSPGFFDAPTERAPGAAVATGPSPWADGGKSTTTTGSAASGERPGTTAHVRRRRWPIAAGVVGVLAAAGGAAAYLTSRERGGVARLLDGADDPWSGERPVTVLPPIDAAVVPRIDPDERDRVRDELADAFARLPADIHIAGGLAITELRQTPELTRLLAGLGENDYAAAASLAMGSCAIQLAARTTWVTFGAVEGTKGFDIVARGEWTRDEVERCLAGGVTSKVQVKRQAVKGREGKPLSIVPRVGADTVVGWIDDHTLVASSRAAADLGLVTAMLDGRPRPGPRSRGSELGLALDRRAAIWFVADHEALGDVVESSVLAAGDGSVRLAFDDQGDLGFQLAIDFPDRAQAEAGQAKLEAELSELTDSVGFSLAFPDFVIRRDGTTVRLHSVLPARLVAKLQDVVLETLER